MRAVPISMMFILVVLTSGVALEAQVLDRIYVDQYMPLRSELMMADADGSNPRKLVPGMEIDYNASFSYDGEWVVFTSDRSGSADIFRVRLDGRDLERLTDSPAFDDQAALSPDNRSLAFVSSRGGSTDIYIMDLASRELRNLTNAPGGDFRPSWSPDGRTIAFSSDRDTGFPHQDYPGPAGKWEHVQAAGVYVIDVDGTGLRKLTTDPEMLAGVAEMVGGRQHDRVLRDARAGDRERALRRRLVEHRLGRRGHRRAYRPRLGSRAQGVSAVHRARSHRLADQDQEQRDPRVHERRRERARRPRQSLLVTGRRTRRLSRRPTGDDAPLLQHPGPAVARHRGETRLRTRARERLAGRVARRPHPRRERAHAERRPDGVGPVGCRRDQPAAGVPG